MSILPFKRKLQTANATLKPCSRDILKFAVCGFPWKTWCLRSPLSIIIVKWEIFRWHTHVSQRHVDLPWWFTLCSFSAFCLPSLPSQPLLGPFTVLCSVEFSFFILSRDQCYTFLWEVGWLTLRTVVMVVVPICILCTFTCLSPTVLTLSTHSPDKYCQSAS